MKIPTILNTNEGPFLNQLVKTFVISTVMSTGTLAGFMICGAGIMAIDRAKKKRSEKKAAETE